MKESITCVRESFEKLSNRAVKEKINIVSPSRIKSSDSPFIAICNNLPQLRIKKNSNIAIISSGENLPTLSQKTLLNANMLPVIGLQEYMIENQAVQDLNLQYFETLSLGEFRDDFKRCEPLLRESEYILLDMKSLKHSDFAPSTNPNGFSAEHICQIAHYIGSSLRFKGAYIYGLEKGLHESAYNLVAQICWIISNSMIHNIYEDPADAYKRGPKASNFQHRIVPIDNDNESIVFVRSLASGRLWMEVSIIKKNKNALIPCSEWDFKQAEEQIVPNRWLVYYSKFNI